jgi:hypothetical protein
MKALEPTNSRTHQKDLNEEGSLHGVFLPDMADQITDHEFVQNARFCTHLDLDVRNPFVAEGGLG